MANVEMAPRTRRFMRELTGTDAATDYAVVKNERLCQNARRQRVAKASVTAVVVPLLVMVLLGLLWLNLGTQIASFQ